MDDSELEAIRARRLAELQGNSGGGGGASSGGPSIGRGGEEGGEDAAERRGQEEERRRTMLAQILDNQARERLSRIAMVKPEKARAVEDLLLKTAQRGGLRSKVTEPQLIGLLGEIAEQQGGQERGKITFDRRRMDDSDTDDSDY